MRRLTLLFSAAAIAGCQCDRAPCANDLDCASGSRCIANFCQGPGGTGTGTGNGAGGSGGSSAGAGGSGGCSGLQCQQTGCPNGSKTSLTGTVFTPKGDLPLYNAIVYVPNAAVAPFVQGVSCDTCGGSVSGSPIVSALTKFDGTFRLDDVPVGRNIPLVIQMGRWRRQVTIANVPACQVTPVADDLTRLPRNKAEGDIPHMAIATGNADPFECLLKKIGLDDAEVTLPTGMGRVHFFRENGRNMDPPAPAASTLWSDVATLRRYDVVMLPCEGSERPKPGTATQNLIDYTGAGGRVFTTHYSYVWVDRAQQPFPTVATWGIGGPNPTPNDTTPFSATIDQSFPKGQAFAQWLQGVGATPTPGTLSIFESRHNVNAVTPARATRWVYGTNTLDNNTQTVQHLTFNTPVADLLPDGGSPQQCGRVVFSDFHVSAQALDPAVSTVFPGICKNEPPSAQEKALIFMLFDLTSCVQRDEIPPIEIN